MQIIESAPLLIDLQGAADAAAEVNWATDADEEINGTTGWTFTENKPFFFLAQPPEGEVFDKIEYEVGEYRLIGTVKRTRTDTLDFQNKQTTGLLTFYPDKIINEYWNEAAPPPHSINGRTVTVKHDDPQFVLTVTYEYSALQFRFAVPAKGLAKGEQYKVLFDLHSKAAGV
jgi:hypothetical protein